MTMLSILNTETIYALGLANNAISYLVDIKYDYGKDLGELTMVHKRINSLYGIELFNPFNIILDSSVRDIAYLFKIKELNENDIIKLVNQFNLSPRDLSLLIARLLFPTTTFDLLEDQYNIKRDIKLELLSRYKTSINDLKRIGNLLTVLIKYYTIRPIDWLLKI